MKDLLKNNIPKKYQDNFFLFLFGLTKIPMIFFVGPSIVNFDKSQCVIKIPLNRRTKNHLNSMYFGALSTGADIAGGLVAMREISKSKKKVSLSFKDFHAEFLKRAEGDVHFICNQVEEIKEFVSKVISSKERMNFPLEVTAIVPKNNNEVVANFTLTLSLKLKD